MKRKIFLGEAFGCGINYQNNLIYEVIKNNDILTDNPSEADIIIFAGTCACTKHQIFTTVGYMAAILEKVKERKDVVVYMTGCLTRPFRLENDFFDKTNNWISKNIDIIIPQNNPYQLLDLLYPSEFVEYKDFFGYAEYYGDGRAKFYISNGCNNRCAFCKINYQTWPLTSVPLEIVKDTLDELNDIGDKIDRLTFMGANLSQYGYDLDGQYHLPELVEYVEEKENILGFYLGGFSTADAIRFGFSSVLRDSSKFLGFGGSLESGSNRILKMMNKNVTIEDYIDFIKCIKSKKDKDLSLSIIAGFPTENLEDVKMTLQALKEISPTYVDICRYTDSPFIPSHNFEQLSPDIIQEHARIYSKVLRKRNVDSTIRLYSYKDNLKQ